MVKIECLVCGKTVKIPQSIDTDNYDGQVVCQECTSLLHLKLVKSKLRKYKVVEKKFRPVQIQYIEVVKDAEHEPRE